MRISLLVAFAGRGSGGPEVFERELIRALPVVAPGNEYHLFCLDRRARSVIDAPDPQLVYHQVEPQSRAIAMLTSLPVALSRARASVFHAIMVPPPFCPARTIMAMACSSLLLRPKFYPFLIRQRLRFLLHRAARRAEKIVCPSAHVRDAVHDELKISLDRLPVIPPGISQAFAPAQTDELKRQLIAKYGIDFPYFLFSGRWEPRKNLVRILKAFSMFKKRSALPHKLVLTGMPGWNSREIPSTIQNLGIEKDVLNLGKSPLEELPCLYAGADALIYASLWEGFGMPIIEAMASGTPVITSNVSAMPETAGGAALLVDPHSEEDIEAGMSRIALDLNLRRFLRVKGLERSREFSWHRTARETADLYDQVNSHCPL